MPLSTQHDVQRHICVQGLARCCQALCMGCVLGWCLRTPCPSAGTGGGLQVTYLPVKSDGLIDMQQLKDAIRPETAIVSIMMVNNEIGAATVTALPSHTPRCGSCPVAWPHGMHTPCAFRSAQSLQMA